MIKASLLGQVGLIANVKLHFFKYGWHKVITRDCGINRPGVIVLGCMQCMGMGLTYMIKVKYSR